MLDEQCRRDVTVTEQGFAYAVHPTPAVSPSLTKTLVKHLKHFFHCNSVHIPHETILAISHSGSACAPRPICTWLGYSRASQSAPSPHAGALVLNAKISASANHTMSVLLLLVVAGLQNGAEIPPGERATHRHHSMPEAVCLSGKQSKLMLKLSAPVVAQCPTLMLPHGRFGHIQLD